jgi:ATP-dependent RNA helicase RhlE
MNTRTKSRYSRSGASSGRRRSATGRGSRNSSNRGRGNSQGRGGRKMPSFNPLQFINKNPVETTVEIYKPQNTFETFGIDRRLVRTLAELGITIPSPIQDQIIPEILKGNDVIGLAETGTGKTAAFLLPLIDKTLKQLTRQTLILAPTRELAIQIEDELKKLVKGLRILSTVCVGGTNIRPQIRSLKRKSHFIIGTPGRILDLINRKDFVPNNVTTVVLDEADRMLDMGFINDIRSILGATPKDRETLFFSATTSKESDAIVHDFLQNPVSISVKKKDVTNSIEQDVVRYDARHKYETLALLLRNVEFKRVIIFGSMKHSVEKLSKQLSSEGIQSESIHGNKSHGQRQNSLNKFKNGYVRVLVATDVAARGIHVDDVSHVINYDLPQTFEDYVHRIGRTGRADEKGKALTFVEGQ